MGLMQRRKGRAFEQKIAHLFRTRWPSIEVARGQQGDKAWTSDVYCTGEKCPDLLRRIWWELTDGANPDPLAKLEQAERDHSPGTLPVVVWHRLRERTVWATLRLGVLGWLVDRCGPMVSATTAFANSPEPPITLDLNDLMRILDAAHVAAITKREE